jgi:hypothetical protein
MDYHFIIKYIIPEWAYFILFGCLGCCACWCFYDEHLRGFVDKTIQCLKCERGGRRRIVVRWRVGEPITTAKIYPESIVV